MEIKSLKINGELHEKLKGLSSTQKTSLQDMVEDKLYELVGREEDLLFDIKDITRNIDDSYNIVLDESSYRKLIHFFEVFITNRSLNNISEIQSMITVIQKLKVCKKDSTKIVDELIEDILGTRGVVDDGEEIEVVDIEDFEKNGRSVLKTIIESVNLEEINEELESLKEKANSDSESDYKSKTFDEFVKDLEDVDGQTSLYGDDKTEEEIQNEYLKELTFLSEKFFNLDNKYTKEDTEKNLERIKELSSKLLKKYTQNLTLTFDIDDDNFKIETLDENIDIEEFDKKSCNILQSIIKNSGVENNEKDKKCLDEVQEFSDILTNLENEKNVDIVFKTPNQLEREKREELLKEEFAKLGIEDSALKRVVVETEKTIKPIIEAFDKEILNGDVSYEEETINHIKNITKFINNNEYAFLADIKKLRIIKEMSKKIVSNDHNYLCDLFFEDYKFFEFLLKEKCVGIRKSVEWYKDTFYPEQQFVIDDIKNIVIIVDAIKDVDSELYKIVELYKTMLQDVYYLQSDLDNLQTRIYKEFKKYKFVDITDKTLSTFILKFRLIINKEDIIFYNIEFLNKEAKDEFFAWFNVKVLNIFSDDEQINVEEFKVLDKIKFNMYSDLRFLNRASGIFKSFYSDANTKNNDNNINVNDESDYNFILEMEKQIEINFNSCFKQGDKIYDIVGNEYTFNCTLNNIIIVTNNEDIQEEYGVNGFYKKFIEGNKKYIALNITYEEFIKNYKNYIKECSGIFNYLNLIFNDSELPLAIRNLYKNNIIKNVLFDVIKYDLGNIKSLIDSKFSTKLEYIRTVKYLLERIY